MAVPAIIPIAVIGAGVALVAKSATTRKKRRRVANVPAPMFRRVLVYGKDVIPEDVCRVFVAVRTTPEDVERARMLALGRLGDPNGDGPVFVIMKEDHPYYSRYAIWVSSNEWMVVADSDHGLLSALAEAEAQCS